MFLSLLKVQLDMLMSGMFNSKSKKQSSKGRKALFVGLYAFVFLLFGGAFSFMLFGFGILLEQSGSFELYFPLVTIIASALALFGTMMSAEKLLFEGRDNELLLSMPIPHSYILASRISSLAVMETMFAIIVLVPSLVVFFLIKGITVLTFIYGFIGMICIAIPPLLISVLLGRILSEIHSRSKNRKILDMIFYFLFFGVYIVFYYNVNGILNYILDNSKGLIDIVNQFPPLKWWGNAMIYGDILSFILLVVTSVALLVCGIFILSRGYKKLVSRSKTSRKKAYKTQRIKENSPMFAMLKMELGRFFGTPLYVFNCGLGSVISVFFAIFIVFDSGNILNSYIPELFRHITPIIIGIISLFFSATISTSSISISIEGKFFPMIKTFPISWKTFFDSKILLNMIVALPSYLLFPIITCIGLGYDVLNMISLILFGFFFQLMLAVGGLLINLKMPKLEWTNIAMVIKQSGSVLITTFGGMILMLLFMVSSGVLGLLFQSINPSLMFLSTLIHAVFFALLSLLFYVILLKKGEKMINKI